MRTQREANGVVRQADPPNRPPRVDLASNDYLGLSRDWRVLTAAREALDDNGSGARASRVARGTLPVHRDAELALARLTDQPDALVFSSGYTANLAVVTALADADTLIVSDQHVHASLIDGTRLARGQTSVFPHQDVDAAQSLLLNRSQARAIVLVESVYSVLGDAAPLLGLVSACRDHDALLVVDEAHGLGVRGDGRGRVHELGLAGDPHVVVTATLSKALGAQGGVVLGPTVLREHLVNTARSFIFDTALAPPAAAAACAAAEVVLAEPDRARSVFRVAEHLCSRLRHHGRDLAGVRDLQPSDGAVQSVPMPSARVAADIAVALAREGIDVGCFRPPSVPDGVSRLRLTARATITDTEADEVAQRLAHHLRTALADCACRAGSESPQPTRHAHSAGRDGAR
ncbi:8-amino-7-oxononanoate synthase [Luteipulveratus halotolerans]|uniref:8-amino-7-oxononanoate synthase n=1 Tax=Luteipulveratus halotolerans TaxID=1631356 RepID=UPI0038B2B6F2